MNSNKIFLLFLSLTLLIIFSELSSATSIQISNENYDNEENSTFALEDFIEIIEIKGNDAYVKDLIKLKISNESLNQKFKIEIHTDYRFRTKNTFIANNPRKYLCVGKDYPLIDRDNQLNIGGFYCNSNFYNPISPVQAIVFDNILISYIDFSEINLNNKEINNSYNKIYIGFDYIIKNFVIKNQGEYKFLSIDKLSSQNPTYTPNTSSIFLVLPSSDSILINPDNFEPNAFDSEGRLGLLYWNSEENSFITYRDAEEENKKRTKRDFLLILITLGFSILVGLLTTISSSERTKTLLLIFALFLVVSFYFLLIKDASLIFFIITLFILGFIGFLIILSLKKDKRFGWLKRFYKNIGDLFRKNPKKKSRRK